MGRKMKCLNISITHDQREMFFAMVDHSHRLLMSFFSDIEDMIPFLDTTTRLAVYFFDERTGCVDPTDIALLKRSKKTRTRTMGWYYHQRSCRDGIYIWFKYHSLPLEKRNNMTIVNNLMIDINWWWKCVVTTSMSISTARWTHAQYPRGNAV